MDSKQFIATVKEIKLNKFAKEQQLICSYIDHRCSKLVDEFVSCKDDFERIQGAIRELRDLRRILGDN